MKEMVWCVFLLSGVACVPEPQEDRRVVLWAWQRAEDLSFLEVDGSERAAAITVAPWVGTVRWQRSPIESVPAATTAVAVESRAVPLRVDPARVSRVVVRLENASGRPGELPAVDDVASRIVQLWRTAASSWPDAGLQIDFDAAASERDFYGELLEAVRRELPSVRLEVTALLSWCQEADTGWFDRLPVDGVVPMAFRIGRDESHFLRRAEQGTPLRHPECRRALGLALDEAPAAFAAWAADADELFLFPEEPWTAAQLRRGLDAVD